MPNMLTNELPMNRKCGRQSVSTDDKGARDKDKVHRDQTQGNSN